VKGNGTTAKRKSAPPRKGRAKAAESSPYKLLAIDLDGTFLNHDGVPNDEDVGAIKKLKSRGIKVTILTGRLYSGTRPSAELLGIEGPVGCADGSHIVDVKNTKTLLHRGIRGKAANRLRASLDRNDLVAFLFAEDAIVHDERGADYIPYVRTWSTDLRYAHRVTEHALWDSPDGMTAVVALGREANIGRTVADIQRDTSESMQVAMFPFRRDAEQWGMVARAAGGTKGTALEWIADHYGIKIEETVCVGDWLNDLPMMKTAGRSFAMGQSPQDVKAAATDVLSRTIDMGGGIAEAIERSFGPSR
jgi:Cof subfamily protein (haloacid dehalogenase superfamily)